MVGCGLDTLSSPPLSTPRRQRARGCTAASCRSDCTAPRTRTRWRLWRGDPPPEARTPPREVLRLWGGNPPRRRVSPPPPHSFVRFIWFIGPFIWSIHSSTPLLFARLEAQLRYTRALVFSRGLKHSFICDCLIIEYQVHCRVRVKAAAAAAAAAVYTRVCGDSSGRSLPRRCRPTTGRR